MKAAFLSLVPLESKVVPSYPYILGCHNRKHFVDQDKHALLL